MKMGIVAPYGSNLFRERDCNKRDIVDVFNECSCFLELISVFGLRNNCDKIKKVGEKGFIILMGEISLGSN